jgi:uncharacterized protein (TIGR04255 family)
LPAREASDARHQSPRQIVSEGREQFRPPLARFDVPGNTMTATLNLLTSFSPLLTHRFPVSFRRAGNRTIPMMTDAPKLQINLDEAFPHLTHAPIVEAVIEIRARAQSPWEEPAITEKIKPRLPDYPKVVSQGQVMQEITLGGDQPKSVVHNRGWHGLLFQSEDGKNIAHFNRDGFMFGRLQPYQNWEHLYGEAMRLWKMYVEIAQPLECQRIGLRFVNRIEMLAGEVRCDDYIHLQSHLITGLRLPLMGFFHQDTLAVPGYPLAVNVARTFQPPQTPNAGVAIILDIDAFTTMAFEMKQLDLAQHLPQMRWLKNKVFFGNITEMALNRFK